MTPQRILSGLVLIGGVVLIFIGMNASHSMADQMSNSFYGRFTQGTTWYILGGLAAGILGLYLLLTDLLSKNA
jgi:hypothetical protein